jgi:hypothetical protein
MPDDHKNAPQTAGGSSGKKPYAKRWHWLAGNCPGKADFVAALLKGPDALLQNIEFYLAGTWLHLS